MILLRRFSTSISSMCWHIIICKKLLMEPWHFSSIKEADVYAETSLVAIERDPKQSSDVKCNFL